ncbi:tyrosine-type recombinase/integrase [Spiribacter sp. 221]|uniref:tyrosine-type recombinase/integrase n=1 Tax=Spiribacter onubensis TaxID=3122420 RepID=UPI00349F6F8E
MATFVVRPNGILQYDLFLYGRRFREGTGLRNTPENRRVIRRNVKRINAELETGTFDYAAWFPESPKKDEAMRWIHDRDPREPASSFTRYARQWWALHREGWKPSYAKRIEQMIERYLIPAFGEQPVRQIDERAILAFRESLAAETETDGTRAISNTRINTIMSPLSGILQFAERELGINNPMRHVRTLREERPDVQPLTAEEVWAFLDAVDPAFRLYFEVRFHTGLRTGEINGLKVKHVDVERARLRIREAVVDGVPTSLKRVTARRDVPVSSALAEALAAHIAGREPDEYVFPDEDGRALDPSKVSRRVWHPTLKALGLRPRRVYETRHTAAVLHLAAGENPIFISRLLGHSSGELLFRRYAPFVPNAVGGDGAAFEGMMARVRARRAA